MKNSTDNIKGILNRDLLSQGVAGWLAEMKGDGVQKCVCLEGWQSWLLLISSGKK